jgi:glycosyltransferase involved in cell wall biosynthesis
VFVGGDNNRDYYPVLEAIKQLKDIRFVLATNKLDEQVDIPPNAQVFKVRYLDYLNLLRHSMIAISPIQIGLTRAAGLISFLNSMYLKIPTIVTAAVGVHEYVQDGKTGIIVDGSPDGYLKAIQWYLDPANKVEVNRICEEAHRIVREQFTFGKHVDSVLAVLDEAIAQK